MKERTALHHWELVRYNGGFVNVELSAGMSLGQNNHVATLTLGAHYTTMRGQILRNLMDYTVKAHFEVDGLVSVEDDAAMMPPGLLRMMLGVTIGAIRGMIAIRTAHTFLANFPLPLMDLDALMENMDMNIGEELSQLAIS